MISMPDSQEPIGSQSEEHPTRNELADVSLGVRQAPQNRANETEHKEPVSPQGVVVRSTPEATFHFASLVHEYVWANIVLAEQKAGLIFAAEVAFAAYLLTTLPTSLRHLAPLDCALIALALGLMLSAIAVVITVVIPRLGGDGQGLVYFNAIARRSTNTEYSAAVFQANQVELAAALIKHSYEIACICSRKFNRVRWAVWLGLGGFVCGLVWLVMLHVGPE